MKMKNWLIMLFLVLSAVLLGALIGEGCRNIGFLSWLSYGKSIGIDVGSPLIINLSVVKFAFGFEMSINVAQIFTIIAALLLYYKFFKRV